MTLEWQMVPDGVNTMLLLVDGVRRAAAFFLHGDHGVGGGWYLTWKSGRVDGAFASFECVKAWASDELSSVATPSERPDK